MNLSKAIKKMIPSFLIRKSEVESISNGGEQLNYSFSIEKHDISMDEIKRVILINPWSLISKPLVKMDDESKEQKWTISFQVLSKEKGREIEKFIREMLLEK